MEMLAMATLINKGYNPKLAGTWYLASAIAHTARTGRPMMITKEVYPEVAKQYGTTANAVERGIRRANQDVSPEQTNSEVIHRIALEQMAHAD
jgi:hypothetical protein